MQVERDYISGINLEDPSLIPDTHGFSQDVVIPCPEEQRIEAIVEKHQLDRSDARVAAVLGFIRTMRLNNPQSTFIDALTDNHVQNILHRRWHVYSDLKPEDKQKLT